MAMVKIQASSGWVQSPGAGWVMPMTLVRGSLNTLNA